MDELSRKAVDFFRGKIVRKDLTAMMKRGANVPTYVLEYLLGMYCATDDEAAIALGVSKISDILTNNYVRQDDTQRIKFLIRENGEYTIIDKISAMLDEIHDCYSAQLANLDINCFVLPEEMVKQYTKVLSGGIWCMLRIAYNHKDGDEDEFRRGKRRQKANPWDSPFRIVGMKPIQMPNLDLNEILKARKSFTADEWILLLLRSTGIEASAMNDKERLHYLERLVPLIERNYNLCELGPRGTGKSHLYKEISPYAILMSGGQTTTSNLFYNLRSRQVGLVGNWDCVAFDEVAGMHFRDTDAIQILKDYMASGSFARGRDQINADGSIVFVGNTNDTVENILKIGHLFDPFPMEYNNDSAFFDRIHYYLPGWEVPKMRAEYLTNEYGLISDCLAEFMREMRKQDFSHVFDECFHLNHCVTTRDEIAIRKTVSGLTKLIWPDKSYTDEDLRLVLTYAIEGRRRVKEQLRRMAGDEFSDIDLGFVSSDGSETVINVPEQSHETLIPHEVLHAGHVFAVGTSLSDSIPAVYKLEVKSIRGSGKLEIQGIKGYGANAKLVKEALNAAWVFFQDNSKRIRRDERVGDRDFLLYFDDLQNRFMSDQISVAALVGFCSAAYGKPVLPGIAIIGEITLSGSVKEILNLQDLMRTAINGGAEKILLPESCHLEYNSITDQSLHVAKPFFYNGPIDAVKTALALD